MDSSQSNEARQAGAGDGSKGGAPPLGSKYYNKARKRVELASVRRCAEGSHFLILRNRKTGGVSFVPWTCRSWRCPRCRRKKGAQDFVRIRDAMLSRGPHWVEVVLTLPHKNFHDPFAAFVSLYSMFQKVVQRLSYEYGRIEYFQTVEIHKDGFPHLNVGLFNEKIWQACEGEGWRRWRQVLKPIVVACGFGYVLHVSPLWDGESARLAAYFIKLSGKLSGEFTGADAKNQSPVNAPRNFHRLRSSRGLLAPIFRPGKHVGQLIRGIDIGKVDLSPEGWIELEKGRLERRRAKEAAKQRLQQVKRRSRHG